MKVLVTGVTGSLGRVLVPRLLADGHDVRASSRRPHPPDAAGGSTWVVADVASGAGLAVATDGVDAVVHLASATRPGQRRKRVDVGGTRRVVEAAAAAGVRDLLFVSIVGVDRVPLGYYEQKLAAERASRPAAARPRSPRRPARTWAEYLAAGG
jgi:nucleoside-diphosphate-sugar epimerase